MSDPPLVRSACFALAIVATAGEAMADEDARFAVDRFEPAERGSEWFANESLDLEGQLRPSLGASATYASRPFVVGAAAPVRHLVVTHLGGSVVLVERLRLAVDLPLQAFADGRDAAANGLFFRAPPHEQGLGDLRIGADARVLGVHDGPITVAVGAQLWAPTGNRSQWAGDEGARFRPRVMVAGKAGRFVYAGQLAVEYRERSQAFGPGRGSIGSDVGLEAAAGLKLGELVLGPELLGSTVFATGSTHVEALVGAHWLVARTLRAGAGIGRGLTGAPGSPALRLFAGLEWSPGVTVPEEPAKSRKPRPAPPDRDRDGVLDDVDACPGVPGVRTFDPATNGCPPDTDGDGIDDVADACPTRPGPASEDPQSNGCPRIE